MQNTFFVKIHKTNWWIMIVWWKRLYIESILQLTLVGMKCRENIWQRKKYFHYFVLLSEWKLVFKSLRSCIQEKVLENDSFSIKFNKCFKYRPWRPSGLRQQFQFCRNKAPLYPGSNPTWGIYRQSPIFSLVTNTHLSSLNANI